MFIDYPPYERMRAAHPYLDLCWQVGDRLYYLSLDGVFVLLPPLSALGVLSSGFQALLVSKSGMP